MPDYADLGLQLAWPLALALAWMAGELIYRWTALPRIAVYGLAGFSFGNLAAGYLPPSEAKNFMLLANLGLGLILFELGYRINLRWLRNNPWILLTSVLEAATTFAAVYLVAQWCGLERLSAALIAALAMASSPGGVLRVLNEQGAAGQVTERAMHLTALNCVMGVFIFNVVIGIGVFQTSGDLFHAAGSSLLVLAVSAALGALFGALVPLWLRAVGAARDATLAFALAVILLVSITHVLQFSPVLAALTFGLVARHRRIALAPAQRNFGVLGDVLAVIMFFFVATRVELDQLGGGLAIGVLLVLVRGLVKVGVCTAFARVSGISARKGALTGLALTPMAVVAILLMEQTRGIGVDLFDRLAPLAAMIVLLDVLGPVLTQRALKWASETRPTKEN